MNKGLKRELKEAFNAPIPERKQEFFNNSMYSYPKMTRAEFFKVQLMYIQKRFWVLSIFIIIGMIYFTRFMVSEKAVVGILSAFLPLLTLLGVIEINKSISFDMAELEMSCKHNLIEICLIRLSIIGSFYFILFSFALLSVMKFSSYGFLQTGLYVITPFLFSNYITLFIINRLQSRDTIFACAVATIGVSLATLLLNIRLEAIYMEHSTMILSIALLVIIALIAKETIKIIKRMGELSWNSPLTA